MKRLILVISILFCAQHLFSQTKLSGSVGDLEGKLGFTKANWEIYYDFELVDDKVMLNWTKPKITIPADALYYSEGQTYTKAELGFSTWPTSNQLPYNLGIRVNVSYPGGTVTGLSDCGGQSQQCKSERMVYIDPKKKIEANLFRVVSSKFIMLNSGGEKELDDIIFKQNNKPKSTSKAIPVATKTTDETSKLSSGDKQRALDDAEKKAKDDAFEANTAVIANGISVLTDDIGNLIESIREAKAEKRAIEARNDESNREGMSYFLGKAQQGDTTAMLNLAEMYNLTQSIIKSGNNPIQAFYWFGKATDLGSTKAMSTLITIILTGRAQKERWFHVKYNISYAEAYPWFIKYVTNDKYKDKKFQYRVYQVLADMYSSGLGCTKDKERAKLMKAYYNEWKNKKWG